MRSEQIIWICSSGIPFSLSETFLLAALERVLPQGYLFSGTSFFKSRSFVKIINVRKLLFQLFYGNPICILIQICLDPAQANWLIRTIASVGFDPSDPLTHMVKKSLSMRYCLSLPSIYNRYQKRCRFRL